MRIVWSPRSIANLRSARRYISEHHPSAAEAVGRAIVDSVAGLVEFPGMGRPGRVPGTRELVVSGTPFVVPYRVRGEVIQIIAVLHGARRWP